MADRALPVMRLLLLSHTVNPWTPHYARFFQSRGDQVLVVSFSAQPIDGVDMAFIGVEPWDKYANKHLYLTRVPRLRKLIKRFRPDVVYAPFVVSNGLAAVLAWGGPTVTSGRGGDVLEQIGRVGWRRRLRERLVRFVCRRCVMVHSVSAEITDHLRRLGVPESKLVQIPVGIDTSLFHPAPDMPRPQATRFICPRKHEPVYDNMTVVEALGRLKTAGRSFRCVIASEGSLLQTHQARVRELGLADQVSFPGEVPHAQVPAMLREADVYISATHSDGTSSALLEAMATGLLPVVSRIPANEPWIEHGRTGLLFEPGRPDSLAEMLERAMDDAELRRRAFEANLNRVREGGDQQQNMRQLAEVLEQVVARHLPSRVQ